MNTGSSGETLLLLLFVAGPVVLFGLLCFLPRKTGVLLSVLAIALTFYAFWINATDKPNPRDIELGPGLRAVQALVALPGPVMALVFHLIDRRTWRWRLACFVACIPLSYGLIGLYDQF